MCTYMIIITQELWLESMKLFKLLVLDETTWYCDN